MNTRLNRLLTEMVRVVVVPVPRWDSARGRVLATFDANPRMGFTVDQIAARLGMDVGDARQTVGDLRTRGFLIGTDSGRRAGRQPVYVYRLSPDLSAHVPPKVLAEVAA